MSVVLALSKSAASFSVRTARFGGAAARLMSVKGGSIPESESDKVLYTLGLSIAREVGSPEYKSLLAYRFLLKGRSISESDSDMFLYSLGFAMARQVGAELKPQLTKEEVNTVILGFTDSKAGKVPDELGMIQKYDPKTKNFVISRKEKAKGLDFTTKYLEANPTAVNTASGLLYHETVPGLGVQPTADSTVEVHYHGTTVDGTVFDSSAQRGETVKFPLKSVIAGWQEGVAMMKVGGKATLVCPSEIAYGESGSPPVILPGATLVFEVELINVL